MSADRPVIDEVSNRQTMGEKQRVPHIEAWIWGIRSVVCNVPEIALVIGKRQWRLLARRWELHIFLWKPGMSEFVDH